MPGKNNKPKSSAGESGLSTETTSGGQAPDHSMNPDESSVAAVVLPRKELTTDEGDAAIKAFNELYGTGNPSPPRHEPINVENDDADKDNEEKDNEEEDVFLLPNPEISPSELLNTSLKS